MRKSFRNQGIAIVAVLLSAVIFLGIIVAITGTLSISSRRTTGDQRVTLEAQYAAESGLSRVSAEAEDGLLTNWTQLFLRMRPPTNANEALLQTFARKFCNQPVATILPSDIANETYCSYNDGPDNYAGQRFDIFSKMVSNGSSDDITDSDGRSDEDYKVGTVNTLGGLSESAFWNDVFSGGTNNIRYTREISSGIKYDVSFGLIPIGVKLISGSIYRFRFKPRDAVSTGTTLDAAGKIISTRATSRAFQDEYYVDLAPPSFAYFLSLTNRQAQAVSPTKEDKVYFTTESLFDGPVHTNGTFNFRGRPWFASEVTSSGCSKIDAVDPKNCAAGFSSFGAIINDGNPPTSTTSQTITVDYSTDPNALASFPGYNPANPGQTSPEFVSDNFDDATRTTYTPNSSGAPWNYTGRYDSKIVKFPTLSDDQKNKAQESGIYVTSTPDADGVFVDTPPVTEFLATSRLPSGLSTDFAPVATTGSDPTHQLIRLHAKQSIERCPASPTGITIDPPSATIPSLGNKQFTANVQGPTVDTYESAAVEQAIIWSHVDPFNASGTLNTNAGPNSTYTSVSGSTTGTPVVITAKAAKDPSKFASANLKITAPVGPTLTVTPNTSTVCGTNVTVNYDAKNSTSVSINGTVVASNGTPKTLTGNKAFTLVAGSFTNFTVIATGAAGTVPVSKVITIKSSTPPSGTFNASSTSLPIGGGSVNLNWNISGATSVSIDNGVGTVSAVASKTVSVTATTTFTLTAKNSDGCTKTYSVTITVATPPAAPPTVKPAVTLTANPPKIYSGNTSKLTWNATNSPTSVSINQGMNIPNSPSGNKNTPALTSTTIYTLTATNAVGTSTTSTTVTVVPKPTGTITVSKTSMNPGDTVRVSWTTTNADAVRISGIGSGLATSGFKDVTLTSTTTFELFGNNQGVGELSLGSKTVNVVAPVTYKTLDSISITGNNQNVLENAGNLNPGWTVQPNFTGSGTTPNVTYTVTVSPSSGVTASIPSSGGSVSLVVGGITTNPQTFTVTVTATPANGPAKTASKTIKVTKEATFGSKRPRARLTAITCTTGTSKTYTWPVFVEYMINKNGNVFKRIYGSETANGWTRPTDVTIRFPENDWKEQVKKFNGMLYVDGGVIVKGPERDVATQVAPPAIASFQAITIASEGSITLRNDLKYETPVCSTSPTRQTNQVVTPAECEEDQSKWARNVLGLYTSNGNIIIDPSDPKNPGKALKDITINAVSMAAQGKIAVKGISQDESPGCPDGNNGSVDLDDPDALGSINIQGGLIQQTYGQFNRISEPCGYGRRMTYDRRMKYNKYAPPFFPKAEEAQWQIALFSSKDQNNPIEGGQTLPLQRGFTGNK
jgi:Domain of unknown function (DUF4900)